MRTALAASLLGLSLLGAAPASAADVFSPGPLARGHEKLEGLPNCTRCHAAGQQLSPDRCLACHGDVKARIEAGRGFHGRLPAGERACEACHHEHQGRDFALMDFGEGGEKRFDHDKAGWALRGKHAKLECAACHEKRRVAEADAKEAARKGRRTFLGLPKACSDCHFDEHRGQSGLDCAKCHDEKGWKPAPGFDHAKTAYALEGRHQKVACDRCHKGERDPAGRKAFPAAVSERFLRYKPLAHASCADCHKDPHQGRFAGACATCHAVESWTRLKAAPEATAFHDKARYPLRGKHAEVDCKACHGPFAGEKKARWKGLAFGACADCHSDAHVGQLGKRGTPEAACDRCHGLAGFVPVRFDLAEHGRTRYPLEGGHRAVACVLCHPRDSKLGERLPAAERARLAKQGRAAKVSLARFDRGTDARRCQACHKDPHGGQFAARMEGQGCVACHQVASFKRLSFDHGRDSRFPLDGKHARVACAACHRPAAGDGGTLVRYRPLETVCAACHPDPHAGQFAAGGRTDCARCHGAEDWKKTRFDHAPPFTSYRLEGKHARVACEKCHPAVPVGRGVEVRRYKPLPRACEACHQDFHKGAMRRVEP